MKYMRNVIFMHYFVIAAVFPTDFCKGNQHKV